MPVYRRVSNSYALECILNKFEDIFYIEVGTDKSINRVPENISVSVFRQTSNYQFYVIGAPVEITFVTHGSNPFLLEFLTKYNWFIPKSAASSQFQITITEKVDRKES